MKLKLASRNARIQPSATLAITAKANELKAKGIDVVGFGAGEPDFDTPDHIKQAAKTALDKGQTKYTPVGGTKELKETVCAKFRRDYGLDYTPAEILISVGGKHSLFNIFMALVEEGDEVIIPAPYWVSYPEMVAFCGGTPVCVPTKESNGFCMTPAELEAAITPRTKIFILNSPSNPTGGMYSEEHIRALAAVLEKHPDIWIVSDDIYEKLTYDGMRFFSIATISPAWKARTIVCNGMSKAYSMTGWRIGFTAAPKDLTSAMDTIQGQSTSNPTSIAQAASVAGLSGDHSFLTAWVAEFDRRRRYIVERLNRIPGISCFTPKGAFYAFPNISGLLGKKTPSGKTLTDSMGVAAWLIEEHNVAVVPGAPFGAEGFMRLSYATSMEQITKGLDRIETAAKSLK
ncbi:MAG: pyridoxal phosphate-dependent aminotransferase [Deltaproteobacteria bacterium]|nr:pyridoxal phosphate-dependent aminotransferase [Deltaproteobacteria bacterium]